MPNKSNCSTCDAPLVWRTAEITERNPNPKPNPLDAMTNAKGNIILLENGHYRVLSKAALEQARAMGWKLYISHFVTCKDAAKFRRK